MGWGSARQRRRWRPRRSNLVGTRTRESSGRAEYSRTLLVNLASSHCARFSRLWVPRCHSPSHGRAAIRNTHEYVHMYILYPLETHGLVCRGSEEPLHPVRAPRLPRFVSDDDPARRELLVFQAGSGALGKPGVVIYSGSRERAFRPGFASMIGCEDAERGGMRRGCCWGV